MRLKARLEERHAAESQLRALCGAQGVATRVCDELITAFNEAFNNVVIHAYRGQEGGSVEVSLLVDADRVVIELSDSGRSFDIAAVPPPHLASHETPDGREVDKVPEGGYGVHIMKTLMSEVSYQRSGAQNVLRMVRHLRPNA